MFSPTRLARYDIRNDGVGPYAVFYCDQCGREYRSQPDVGGTIVKDIGRQTASDLLRRVPLFGRAAADNLLGEDARYSVNLTPGQLDKAWNEVKAYFRECETCHQITCLSDFDEQTGYCREHSPRSNEIAQAEAEQAASVVKGIANVFGLGDAIAKASEAAQQAARANACPSCGAATGGAKFCPECGTKTDRSVKCPSCGTDARGAKFCPECGTKIG
jgi:ribosomal protein L32